MANNNAKKIIMLVANGFNQTDFISLQRSLMGIQLETCVVSSEKNLVNGFNGDEWGLTFPVDRQIDQVLGADFDAVIVVGGAQSVKRLEANPHMMRILDSFADSSKPVVLLNEAGVFALDDASHVLHIEGEVSETAIDAILSHIAPVENTAKAA